MPSFARDTLTRLAALGTPGLRRGRALSRGAGEGQWGAVSRTEDLGHLDRAAFAQRLHRGFDHRGRHQTVMAGRFRRLVAGDAVGEVADRFVEVRERLAVAGDGVAAEGIVVAIA